jgi:ParB family transcriptional regulator, chromosome partitioning protein
MHDDDWVSRLLAAQVVWSPLLCEGRPWVPALGDAPVYHARLPMTDRQAAAPDWPVLLARLAGDEAGPEGAGGVTWWLTVGHGAPPDLEGQMPASENDEPVTMPVDGASQAANVVLTEVPLSLIDPSPVNPRDTLGTEEELDAFAADVSARGLLQPITVAEQPDGRYRVVYGHRRCEAARRAGLDSVSVLLREGGDPATDDLDRLAENSHRRDLSPLEEAKAFQRVIEVHGLTQAAVAAAIGTTKQHVTKRLTLLRLVPEAVPLLADGRLPVARAVEWAREDPEVQADATRRVTAGASPAEPAAALTSARMAAQVRREREQAALTLRARGVEVYEGAPLYGPRATVRVLDEPFLELLAEAGVADHAALACHAVTVSEQVQGRADGADPVARWGLPLCTDPQPHRDAVAEVRRRQAEAAEAGRAGALPTPAPSAPVPRDPAAEAREAARAERQREVAAAARERQEFITWLVRGSLDEGWAHHVAQQYLLDGLYPAGQVPSPDEQVYELAAALVGEERAGLLEAMSGGAAGAVRWALALRLALTETLLDPSASGGYYPVAEPVVRAHLRFLAGRGMGLTAVDEEYLREYADVRPYLVGVPGSDPDKAPGQEGACWGDPGLGALRTEALAEHARQEGEAATAQADAARAAQETYA